jgi:hypothetical protein
MHAATLILLIVAAQAKPDAAAGQPAPAAAEMNDAIAKEMLAKLDEGLKSKDTKERVKALEPFLSARHKSFVAPLAAQFAKGPVETRVVAARALGVQRYDPARVALTRVLTNKKIEPEVLAAAVEGLGTAQAKGTAKTVIDLFENESVDPMVKKEVIRALGTWKDPAHVEFLGKQLDEPAPANPDSPSNPPAAYWEKRWKEWNTYKDDVQWALKEITGKSLRTQQEVKDWLKKRK